MFLRALLLLYRFFLPIKQANETSTHFLVANLQDQTQNLASSLYNGNVTVRVDSSWGVSGFGGKARRLAPYLPYSTPTDAGPLVHQSAYERCKLTRRCPRANEHYNISAATKRFSYQAFDGGRHHEMSDASHLPFDPVASAAAADAAAASAVVAAAAAAADFAGSQEATAAAAAAAAVPEVFLLPDGTIARTNREAVLAAASVERARGTVELSGGGNIGGPSGRGSGSRVGLFADFEDWHVGSHGWRRRGGPPPHDPQVPPNGAHFSPLAFESLGPSVPTPPPPGRASGQSRGAQRQSDDGPSTDSQLHYLGQDWDRFQNRGLNLNNRTLARDLQTQRRLLATLEGDKAWHIAHRQTALLDATLRSRLDVDRFMTKRYCEKNTNVKKES